MHLNRYQAFLTHLLISATIVGIFLLLTFFVLYPSPLFTVEGTVLPIQILVAVDVVLGPLLTLIVFKPNKPSLKFDLSVIAAVQLSAFVYGANIIWQERPAFMAFAVDRFAVVPQADTDVMAMNELDTNEVSINTFGPTWVYATFPETSEERQQLTLEVINGGLDIDKRPGLYRNYKKNIARNFENAINLKAYASKYTQSESLINNFLVNHNKKFSDVAAYPVDGKHHDLVIVIDKHDLSVIGSIDIDPWLPLNKTEILNPK